MLDECWRVHFDCLVWKCKTKGVLKGVSGKSRVSFVFPLGGKFRWLQQPSWEIKRHKFSHTETKEILVISIELVNPEAVTRKRLKTISEGCKI